MFSGAETAPWGGMSGIKPGTDFEISLVLIIYLADRLDRRRLHAFCLIYDSRDLALPPKGVTGHRDLQSVHFAT